ncbi:hypothetical protein DFH07DRAFT_901632 [Mycena maculata]|uniref:HD/PDEase domain-containing protein n=1 Tax=Mycena maculata TaxID=230809 RepID=A0AAD7NUX7_9AGAR|nr:hypothetical protein DFH07DRAFT_901632 [Mycena maculata]
MVESPSSTQMRYFKDQIHDYMSFSPLLCSIIDTRPFQRLRHIKQLGTTYYVWSGASHNRFEHCLGVAHLARKMAKHLRKKQPELEITDRDIDCVQIAGLCHDLGHGPWSHVWDGLFIPAVSPTKNWKHEDASKMMFKYLLESNNINLPVKDVNFVLALIDGDAGQCSPDEKPFLFDIVANKRNGLDVDKFDYIARDSYMIGEPSKLSLARLIKSARVINNEICYNIKDVNQLHEICYTRFRLHKMIYNHKTAKAIEYMIVDALKLAEPIMKIAEQIDNPKKFLFLTDAIMSRIEESDDPRLEDAQAIFDRIAVRDLYKFVDGRVIEWERRDIFKEHITSARIVEEAKKIAREQGSDKENDLRELTEDSVIVDHATMHYGMKDENPLDFVRFYSKRNVNLSAQTQKGDYSMLMPPKFAEVNLTVFTKHPEYLGLVQAGYRAVLLSIPDIIPVTPVERPTTPTRGHRRSGRSRIAENSFTTVPLDFVPSTPSRTRKRSHEPGSMSSIEEDERESKRRAQ